MRHEILEELKTATGRLQTKRVLLLVLLLVLGSTVLHAGAVLRVGPGRTYTDIQSAINAASNGDLILVDAGTYAGFFIPGKGVSVLSATVTPFTLLPNPNFHVVGVAGVPAGQSATVMGFNTTVPFGGVPPIHVAASPGSVRIGDAVITLTTDLPNVGMRSVIEILSSASVWLNNVQMTSTIPRSGTTFNSITAPAGPDEGISGILIDSSNVQIQRTIVRGYDNPGSPDGTRYAGDAIRMFGSSILRIGTTPILFTGGTGGKFGGSAIHSIGTPASLDVLSRPGGGAFVKGGGPRPGGFFAVNWDRGIQGAAERKVPTVLPAEVGDVIAAARVQINTTHNVVVGSSFGRNYWLYLGPTLFQSVIVPGAKNTAYLDYTSPSTVLVANGVLPAASPAVIVPLLIPNVPSLAGTQIGAQALLEPPVGQTAPLLSFSCGEFLVVVP